MSDARFAVSLYPPSEPPRGEVGPFRFRTIDEATTFARLHVGRGGSAEIHDVAGRKPVLVQRLTPGPSR